MTKSNPAQNPLVVTGAAGRIGRLLRVVWGQRLGSMPILWSARRPGQGIDLVWDIGRADPPDLPFGAIFLNLAGQTRGTAAELAENRQSAAALARVARDFSALHVFHMSSVAVYAPATTPIGEDTAPAPQSGYGRAKLEAEGALAGLAHTILRLGNLAGADALLEAARTGPVTLDPIASRPRGPERSYIGPRALASALEALISAAAAGADLPAVLNIAQSPALAMADLLDAAGIDWQFGPPRAAAIPCMAVATDRLASCVDLPPATAASVIADLGSLRGLWP